MKIRKTIPEKFYGNTPLEIGTPEIYPLSLNLHYNGFEKPKPYSLVLDFNQGKKIPVKADEMIFGCRMSEEKLKQFDFLHSWDGGCLIVNGRALKILEQICPNDFEAFRIVIKNFKEKQEPFINKDYYIVNILNRIEIIDWDAFEHSGKESIPLKFTKMVFKNNAMQGHKLVVEKTERWILFSSDLAKIFYEQKFKGLRFYADYEIKGYPLQKSQPQ